MPIPLDEWTTPPQLCPEQLCEIVVALGTVYASAYMKLFSQLQLDLRFVPLAAPKKTREIEPFPALQHFLGRSRVDFPNLPCVITGFPLECIWT